MCVPVLQAVGLGLTAGQTAYGVVKDKEAARDEAEAAGRRELFAEHQAADAVARGEREAAITRSRGSQMIGEQTVYSGASGVDVASGTPGKVAEMTRVYSEVDAATIRANAAREAWGYKVEALEQSDAGRVARKRGDEKATGTFLTGVGRTLDQYGQMKVSQRKA